jgi:hypothetical protein
MLENFQLETGQNEITMSLEYLRNIDFVQCDDASYRLTGFGKYHIENPQPNWDAITAEQQEKSNRIATRALYIAALSLCVAIASLWVTWLAWTNP